MSELSVGRPYLFNFAASYAGGGLKRLHEYARWFNDHGGAYFIIHPNSANLIEEFPQNRYFVVRQPRYRRLYQDAAYLTAICVEIGMPELYYAYGIPIYRPIGKINWFHLSNVLPVYSRNVPLSLFDRAKLRYLGWMIRRHYRDADILSAESRFSLKKMRVGDCGKLVLSVNGSDDEMRSQSGVPRTPDEIAVVVGTYGYKALDDAYRVFEMLRQKNNALTFVIVGDKRRIPADLREKRGVIVAGTLPRPAVVEYLSRAHYYISTTRIENSYNAASEGIFLAAESYISDIGPHRELLEGTRFELTDVPGVQRPVIHVRKIDASPDALKSWDHVITDMLARVADLRGNDRPALAASSR